MAHQEMKQDNSISIRTFGEFDILYQGESMLGTMGRSYRILELLKYFIAFREKRLLPESIVNHLFEEKDHNDPKNVLRTQIFRLRKMLEEMEEELPLEGPIFHITFEYGYYMLMLCDRCVVDSDQFEVAMREAKELVDSNPEKAIERYRDGLRYYLGEYLDSSGYGDWTVPIKNRYARLYYQNMIKLLNLLKERKRYEEIMEVCERAIALQPFEESFHILYLEAMIAKGLVQQALSHYEYTTYKLYKDYDIKPTSAMKAVYRRIQFESEEKALTDLNSIEARLTEQEASGAYYCDLEYLRFVYNVEKRKSRRDDETRMLALVTLEPIDLPAEKALAMSKLKSVIGESLRLGDLYAQWNDRQLLMLLDHADYQHIGVIEQRIRSAFEEKCEKPHRLSFSFNRIEMMMF